MERKWETALRGLVVVAVVVLCYEPVMGTPHAAVLSDAWSIEEVADTGGVDYGTSLRFSPSGIPSVVYCAQDSESRVSVRYATRGGEDWEVSVVDRGGLLMGTFTIDYDTGGRPALAYEAASSYEDLLDCDVKLAAWDGKEWRAETVSHEGEDAVFASLAFSPSGVPSMSYFDWTNRLVKFAERVPLGWRIETVDTGSRTGSYTSLAYSPSGRPMIAYESSDETLKLATRRDARWDVEVVDDNGDVGFGARLAVSPSGEPAISYVEIVKAPVGADVTAYHYLKFAWRRRHSWLVEAVDPGSNGVGLPSLAFGPSGHPLVAYTDSTDHSLKFARRINASWSIEVVDAESDSSMPSLALDKDGTAAISYYDSARGVLKLARRKGIR